TQTLAAAVRARRAVAGAVTDAAAATAALADLAEVGARLADAVVRVQGARLVPFAPDAEPSVVDLRTRLDHAAGRTAQHVQTAIQEAWPGARVGPAEIAPADPRLAVLIARITRYGVSADL